jgi:hypothetical protein
MGKKLITTILLAGLVLILAACSTNVNPTGTRPSGTFSAPSAAPTTAPATVEATTVTPSASDTPAPTPTTTTVTIQSNIITAIYCLSGPADTYPAVENLATNQQVLAIGRNAGNEYVLVQSPTNAQKTCWVWKDYITVKGDSYTLPVVSN